MATDVGSYPQAAVPGLHPDPTSKAATLKRSNEDMRDRIAWLKSALHSERSRNQETHREKVMEIRELRDFAELEKFRELEEQRRVLLEEKASEIEELQAKLEANKAREIRELMKKRDKEEAERVHQAELDRIEAEKALAMRVRTETATEVADRLGRENDNLRRMIADLTDQKNKLERLYMHKSEADAAKAEQIRRMHEEADKKTQSLLREGRLEMAREVDARRRQEEKCRRLETEVSKISRALSIVEAEKNTLTEDFQRLKLADAWTRSSPKKAPTSIGAPETRTPRARGKGPLPYSPAPSQEKVLLQKKVESDRLAKDLQKKVKELTKENNQLRKEAEAARAQPAQQASQVASAKQTQSKMESLARRQKTAIKSLEKDLATTRAKLREAEAQVQEQKNAIIKANHSMQSARLAASRKSRDDPGLRDAVDAAKAQTHRAEEKVAEKDVVISQLRKDLKASKHEFRKLKAEFDEQSMSMSTREVGSPNDKLIILNIEHTRLEKRLAHSRQDAASHIAEVTKMTKEKKGLEKKIQHLVSEKEQLEVTAADSAAKVGHGDSERAKLHERVKVQATEIRKLESEIAKLKKSHDSAVQAAEAADTAKSDLTSTNSDLEKTRAELTDALAAVDDLTARCADMLEEKNKLADELAAHSTGSAGADEEEITKLRANEALLSSQIEEEKMKIKALEVENDDMRKALENTAQANDEGKRQLEAALASEKETVASLENRITALSEAATSRTGDLANVRAQDEGNAQVAEQPKAAESTARKGKDEVDAARKRAAERRKAKQEAEEKAMREKVQAERNAVEEKAEAARIAEEAAKAEAERKAAEEKAEAERKVAAEKAEAERKAAEEKAEAEQKAAEEKAEAERKAAEEKAEAERKVAAEKAEAERKAAVEKAEAEQKAAEEKAEAERKAAAEKEEAERKAAAEKAEAERKAAAEKEEAARVAAKAESERKAAAEKAEAERKAAAEKAEAERKAAEEKAEAERKAAAEKAEAERKAAAEKAEAERKAAEEKAEAERKSMEEAEEKAAAEEEAQYQAATKDSRFYIAMHEWAGHPEEPSDEDLLFEAQDVLRVLGKVDGSDFIPYDPEEDGFYTAEIVTGPRQGEKGLVPSNFIEMMSEEEAERVRQHISKEQTGNGVASTEPSSDNIAFPRLEDSVLVPLLKEHELEQKSQPTKFYVLHDFDPRADPDRDDVDDELTLFRGEYILKVSETGDDDSASAGFFLGLDKEGACGLVPSTFVTDDPEEIATDMQLMQDGDVTIEDATFSDEEDGVAVVHFADPGDIVVAKHDYDPVAMYPDSNEDDGDGQLSFQQGERLKILEPIADDSFYVAERLLTGEQGYVPGNFIGPADDSRVGGQQFTSLNQQLNLS